MDGWVGGWMDGWVGGYLNHGRRGWCSDVVISRHLIAISAIVIVLLVALLVVLLVYS